jgi:polysaccharide export outer membrane protein
MDRTSQVKQLLSLDLFLVGIVTLLSGVVRVPAQDASSIPAGAALTTREDASRSHLLNALHPDESRVADYVITPGDDLDVSVLEVPDLSKTYKVTPSGDMFISVLQNPILASGLTPQQLAGEIAERLKSAGMLNDPRITVQVVHSRLHSIAIVGAVKHPQIYPLFGQTTVLDALSQAEGLDVDAGNTAVIDRGEIGLKALGSAEGDSSDHPATVKIDLVKLLENGDASQNLVLYPGDRLTVQRAGIVYVVGAVTKSGGFVLRDDRQQMTVLKAVALAENVKSTAEPKKAVIIRKIAGGGDSSVDIPVPLDKILKGRAKDQPLLANDILFVPDSAAKRALHRAGEAAAQGAALTVYRIP